MSDVAETAAAAAQQAPRAARAAVKTVSQAYDQAVSNLKQGVAAATAAAPKMPAFNPGQAVKAVQDAAAFNRANMEALAQSGQILAAGTQDLLRRSVANGQVAYTQALAGLKSLTAVRSVRHGFELQASLAQQTVERTISDCTQLAQDSLKLMERAAAPLAERALQAVEMFTRRAA